MGETRRRTAAWQPSWLRSALWAAAFVVVSVALRLPYFDQPLDRDSALYATIGQQLDFGTLLYVDLFDNKPPGIFVTYWVLDLVAPRQVGAVRLLAALVPAGAALILFWVLAPRTGTIRAAAAALLGLVLGASPLVQGADLNTEHLLVLTGAIPVLAALWLKDMPWRLLPAAIGLAGFLAVLTNQRGGAIALTALIPLVSGCRARGQSVLATVGLFVVGIAAPIVLLVLAFAVVGGLDDLWLATIEYNRIYGPQVGPKLLPADKPELVALTAAALGAGAIRIWTFRGRDLLTWTLVAWLLAAYVGAQVSGREFPHYYAPLILPACALLMLAPAPAWLRPEGLRWALAVAVAAAALVVSTPFVDDWADKASPSGGPQAVAVYGPAAGIWDLAFAVGERLRERARPSDTLFVTGAEPEFYWASGVDPASRWLVDYPTDVIPSLFYREVREMCLEKPPRFLVATEGSVPEYLQECGRERPYVEIGREGPVLILERSG